jgi:hypothetical protein
MDAKVGAGQASEKALANPAFAPGKQTLRQGCSGPALR